MPAPAVLALVALAFALPAAAQANDPVAAASKFVETRGTNCRELWPLYSSGTQESIRAAARRRERQRAGLPRPFEPEREACGVMNVDKPKRGASRLVSQQGDEAVVLVEVVTHPSRFRFDLFPPAKIVTEEVRLVREAGAWRVVLAEARKLPPDEGSRVLEIGPVDVRMPESFNPGLVDRIEATAVVAASRGALERVLRDPQRWALALPGVKAVQPAEAAGGAPRVLLRFEDPDRALPARVRIQGMNADQPRDPSTLTWDAEETPASPVHFRGSWKLDPHEDGSTRITLVLRIDVKQWPGDSARRIFAADRVAQSVLDLEKAAR